MAIIKYPHNNLYDNKDNDKVNIIKAKKDDINCILLFFETIFKE